MRQMKQQNVIRWARMLCVWVLMACGVSSPHAHAQLGAEVGYRVGIASDLQILRDPDSRLARMSATWKTPSEISLARSTPIVRITNTSQTATLTGFSIDINDPMFVFDAIKVAEAPAGVSPSFLSPTDMMNNQNMSPTLRLSFGNRPLLPNESFAFWLDLERSNGARGLNADFRNCLWDQFGNSRLDNATLQATFNAGALNPAPLFDYRMLNETIPRGADGTSGQSVVFPLMHSAELMGAFFFNQVGVGLAVPEPSTGILLGLGLLAGQRQLRKRRSV